MLEQANSLWVLGKEEARGRKLQSAEEFALDNLKARPQSGTADYQLGRVYVAEGKFDLAEACYKRLDELGRVRGIERMCSDAKGQLLVIRRLQAAAGKSKAKDYDLDTIIYSCQYCGCLIRYLSVPCPFCCRAPESAMEVHRGAVLSSLQLTVSELLFVSRGLVAYQRRAEQFWRGFDELVQKRSADPRAASDASIVLDKLKRQAGDNRFDYNTLEQCPNCSAEWSRSYATQCRVCEKPLNKPLLEQLVICVHHLLLHFIVDIKCAESEALATLIKLLVEIESCLIREQESPTNDQRQQLLELISEVGTLTTDNGGAEIDTRDVQKISGRVLDPAAHERIGVFVKGFVDEVKFLVELMAQRKALV